MALSSEPAAGTRCPAPSRLALFSPLAPPLLSLWQVRDLDEPIAPVTLDHRNTRGRPAAAPKPAAAAAAGDAAGAGEQPQEQQQEQAAAAAEVKEEQPGGEAAVKAEPKAEPMDAEAPAAAEAAEAAAPAEEAAVKEEEQAAQDAAEVKAEGEQGEAGPGPGEEGWEGKGYWKRRREAQREAAAPKELPPWGAARGGGGRGREVRAAEGLAGRAAALLGGRFECRSACCALRPSSAPLTPSPLPPCPAPCNAGRRAAPRHRPHHPLHPARPAGRHAQLLRPGARLPPARRPGEPGHRLRSAGVPGPRPGLLHARRRGASALPPHERARPTPRPRRRRPAPRQVARSAEPRPKKLHYVSEAVKFLLRTDVREALKVVGAGVKVFERQDAKVRGRGQGMEGAGWVPAALQQLCRRAAGDGPCPDMTGASPPIRARPPCIISAPAGRPGALRVPLCAGRPASGAAPRHQAAVRAQRGRDADPAGRAVSRRGCHACPSAAASRGVLQAGPCCRRGQDRALWGSVASAPHLFPCPAAPPPPPTPRSLVGLPEGHKMHMTKKAGEGEAQAEAKAEEAAAAAEGGAAAAPAKPAAGGEAAAEGQPAAGAEGAAAAAAPAPAKPVPVPRSHLSNPATLEQLRGVAMGCCVGLMSEADAADLGFERNDLAIACWRGRANLNILVSKQEAAQLRERIADARAKLALRRAGAAAAPAAAAEPVAA